MLGDRMIYLRVRPRVTANIDEVLWLKDVANFIADASCRLNDMRIILPKGAGVWQVDAPQLILQIMEKHPRETVHVLGDGIGWLHREEKRPKAVRSKRRSMAKAAASFVFLAAFAFLLFSMGRDGRWNVLPYAASMLMGAIAYFARPQPMASPSPKRVGHGVGSKGTNVVERRGRRLIGLLEKGVRR